MPRAENLSRTMPANDYRRRHGNALQCAVVGAQHEHGSAASRLTARRLIVFLAPLTEMSMHLGREIIAVCGSFAAAGLRHVTIHAGAHRAHFLVTWRTP